MNDELSKEDILKIISISNTKVGSSTLAMYIPKFDSEGRNVNPDANDIIVEVNYNNNSYRVIKNVYKTTIIRNNKIIYFEEHIPQYIQDYRNKNKCKY